MNISEQIGKLWATHQEDISLVWYLLPASGEAQTAETAANLQEQITNYLLMTPFSPEAGRLVGEQLAQQFGLSLEKLGYLQRLLAEQLLLGLDQTQTAWLAPRLATFWSEMTVGFSYKLRKMYINEEEEFPTKLLSDLQQELESEKHFAALFNDTYSPVVLHENGLILAINKAVSQIFGYSADEIVGQQIQNLVHALAPTKEQPTILKQLAVEYHHSYQTKCFHKTGTEIDIEVTASPIIYDGRKVRMIVLRPRSLAVSRLPELEEVNLSPRQGQVLHYLALGQTDREIAVKLQITLSTVKHHKQELFNKLQVTSRAEAVIWAWQKSNLFAALSTE
jgi:PAS domain S-box-containing protein